MHLMMFSREKEEEDGFLKSFQYTLDDLYSVVTLHRLSGLVFFSYMN